MVSDQSRSTPQESAINQVAPPMHYALLFYVNYFLYLDIIHLYQFFFFFNLDPIIYIWFYSSYFYIIVCTHVQWFNFYFYFCIFSTRIMIWSSWLSWWLNQVQFELRNSQTNLNWTWLLTQPTQTKSSSTSFFLNSSLVYSS